MKKSVLVLLFVLGVLNATGQTIDSRREIRPFTGRRIAARVTTDNCGYFVFGIGTYGDWSEIIASISYCLPSGTVNACSVQPDCNNNEPLPNITLARGEAASTSNFFGFSPWSGFTPCEAITHANAFVCPLNFGAASTPPEPFTPPGGGGPDIQNP